MCSYLQHSFGLTSVPKIDLFLREIQFLMRYYAGMSYWDAYLLPIPVRKFLLGEYAKQIEEENKQTPKANSYIPMTPAEKQLFKSKEKMTSNQANFMQPVRNK